MCSGFATNGGQQRGLAREEEEEGNALLGELGDLLVRAACEMAQDRRETDDGILSRVGRQVHLGPLVEPISRGRVALGQKKSEE